MNTQAFTIGGTIPVALYGSSADRVFLFVHGQGGNMGEGEAFAQVACPLGWQVLSVELPEHGARRDVTPFLPWAIVPELQQTMGYIKQNWRTVGLRLTSIGCWLSLVAFPPERFASCLMVSPLVDMESMIFGMMRAAGVTEERLTKEKTIPTAQGAVLSIEYLRYVRAHPIDTWATSTRILRAEKDERIDGGTVEAFAEKFGCPLTTLPGGQHWLHTEGELAQLRAWEREALESVSRGA